MKVEICISCIDDGRVPTHKVITWELRGNMSRDYRMQQLYERIASLLKQTYPKKTPKSEDGANS